MRRYWGLTSEMIPPRAGIVTQKPHPSCGGFIRSYALLHAVFALAVYSHRILGIVPALIPESISFAFFHLNSCRLNFLSNIDR